MEYNYYKEKRAVVKITAGVFYGSSLQFISGAGSIIYDILQPDITFYHEEANDYLDNFSELNQEKDRHYGQCGKV